MKTRLMLAVLLLLALFVTACQAQGAPIPQDPLEAVKTIADKQKEVKTQHTDFNMTLNLKVDGLTGDMAQAGAYLKNFKAALNVNGDVDIAKEEFALKGDLDLGPLATAFTGQDKISFELVKVGEKLYSKANVGDKPGEWNESEAPKATTEVTQTNPLNPQMVMDLLKQSSKAEKLADEKIGDVDTYHYKVTLNPETLIDSIAKLAQSSGAAGSVDEKQLAEAKKYLKDAVLEVELWVGKQDLLIRQFKVHFNLNLKDIPEMQGATALIDFVLTNTATKINEPVTLTAPK
ncbi:MAG TPA: hypothetical protein VLG46_11665 [Anaerolineae bacterium]|nr:hypothetical protein [Anaerolineae bacterium]